MIIVDRTIPTVQFSSTYGRLETIRDMDSAILLLRLTGEAPWTIIYQTPPSSRVRSSLPPQVTVLATIPNFELRLASPVSEGSYRLMSIRDRFCPGQIVDGAWAVSFLPRPTLSLTRSVVDAKADTVVCQGQPASIQLDLKGACQTSL